MRVWTPCLSMTLVLWITSFPFAQGQVPADKPTFPAKSLEFFESKVRPILVESCLECHGARKQSNGLRLDSREGVLKGGGIEGPSVYLDDPEGSPLLLAVQHELAVPMPPEPNPGLDENQIAALKTWIELGLPWTDEATLPTPEDKESARSTHWAFQPIADPDPPEINEPAQAQIANPIDAFVLQQLNEAGLNLSERADRRTLIRRATFDLTGLPPTPEEVLEFLDDPSPEADAFAKVVDRLLSSTAYGERWGRHWLDVARYADNKGYVFQEERRYPFAFTYRDYVVNAFNRDKPYDQFVKEQVAADHLELETPGDLAALGFLTVGNRFRNNTHDIIDDRIDVVTRGLMGLTVSCARCHDHKYDPIPTADYYSLYGVFASSEEPDPLPVIGAADPGPDAENYEKRVAEKQKEVDEYLASLHAEYQKHLNEHREAYLLAALDLEFQPGNGKLDDVARAREIDPKRLRSFLTRWKQQLDRTKAAADPDPILAPWHALAALPEENFAKAAEAVLDDLQTRESPAVDPEIMEALTREPTLKTFQDVIERYAFAFSEAESKSIVDLLSDAAGPFIVPEDQTESLVNRAERNKLRSLKQQRAAVDIDHPGAPPRAMVLNDKDQLMNPAVFLRGTPGNRGESVPRQFLELLSGEDRQPFEQGSGRLDLAEAIVSPENPLTARVMANRIWMYHFDNPLVGTPGDFGTRSEPPTHPELLDWLARRFQAEGWSIKAMHLLILASNTYAQQSLSRPEGVSADPENRLLWRQNRRRLDLESMRDALLLASGRLDSQLGGRPGPSPDDPAGNRRTLYSFIDRQNLPSIYRTFDFPNPNISSPARNATTVPQQALFLLNSPFVAEQARQMARKAKQAADSADLNAQIDWLYQNLFTRSATPKELELGRQFLEAPEVAQAPTLPTWQFGYGEVIEDSEEVEVEFTPLPHFTGDSWQFGPEYPHLEGKYLSLKADSGHVGHGQDRAAIRRWVAPFDATIKIEGRLVHRNEKGDGVRGRIVAGEGGLLGDWVAHNRGASTGVDRYEVQAGETIDFVADCRAEPSFDSFNWAPRIQVLESGSTSEITAWDAKSGFGGPAPEPLSRSERYAQILLLTNEFLFVD